MDTAGADDPVRTFVQSALSTKESGNAFQYNVIITQLHKREDPETIWRVMVAMEAFAPMITARSELYRDLIRAIFNYTWDGEERLNIAMMDLILAIISNNVTFAKLAYRSFIHTFTRSHSSEQEEGMFAVFFTKTPMLHT